MKPVHLLAPAFALSVLVPATLRAHSLEGDMASAAHGFLATLTPEPNAQSSFTFVYSQLHADLLT
jgi:hypothetical protein